MWYRGLARAIRSEWGANLLSGVLFSLIHLPNPWLTGLTFILGVVFAWIYRRAPNLFALGIVHGILGTCVNRFLGINMVVGYRYIEQTALGQ